MAEPRDALVFERREWGKLFGFVDRLSDGDTTVAQGSEAWQALQQRLPAAQRLARRIDRLEKSEIGGINHELETARLEVRGLQRRGADAAAVSAVEARIAAL